jgi:hypothetical protein
MEADMTHTSRFLVLACGACVALALCGDPCGADNCETYCQMRRNHYSCTLAYCAFHERAQCARCWVDGNYCIKVSNPNTLCSTQGTNRVGIYYNCLLSCDCCSTCNFVEAEQKEIIISQWFDLPWSTCIKPDPNQVSGVD